VKTKNEKEHNAFLHIVKAIFLRVNIDVIQSCAQKSKKKRIKTHAILMYFNII